MSYQGYALSLAIAAREGSVAAIAACGRLAHQEGALEEAEYHYRSALSLDPNHSESTIFLAVVLLERGLCTQARSLVERLERPSSVLEAVNLSAVLIETGLAKRAINLLEDAIVRLGRVPAMLANLSLAYEHLDHFSQALLFLTEAYELEATSARARRVGLIHARLGDPKLARSLLRPHARSKRADIEAALGLAAERLDKEYAALVWWRRAHRHAPGSDEIALNLAKALFRCGHPQEAACLASARMPSASPLIRDIALNLSHAMRQGENLREALMILEAIQQVEIHCIEDQSEAITTRRYGLALTIASLKRSLADYQGAVDAAREALAEKANDPEAFLIKAEAEHALGSTWQAIASIERLLTAHPSHMRAMCFLVHLFSSDQNPDRAAAWARRIVDSCGDNKAFLPAVAMALQVCCDFDLWHEIGGPLSMLNSVSSTQSICALLALLPAAATRAETKKLLAYARRWGSEMARACKRDRVEKKILSRRAMRCSRRRDRPRVGFLSGDLRAHSVAKFLEPLFAYHDPERIELYGYLSAPGPMDVAAERFRAHCSLHRQVFDMNDSRLHQVLRDDELDILVDPSGLTLYGRCAALVDRVAPIQIQWFGYPISTGLKSMDYMLVDRYVRPIDDNLLKEKPLELPTPWLCWGWPVPYSPVESPPCQQSNYITFGTLNNPYKYSKRAVSLWARVLRHVPQSRFLIVRPEARSAIFRTHLTRAFEAQGVCSSRIEFFDNRLNGVPAELCYNYIDISLDTWPLTGGTTTCDSLDMGVPVITLAGPALHQRMSHAMLTQGGAAELSASTPREYVDLAVSLAHDYDRLADYRVSLRSRLHASPLCDGISFARGFEACMRDLACHYGLLADE